MSWRKAALWDVVAQTKQKIIGPYNLRVVVERPDRRRRDLDNVIKALSDVLVTAKIIEDDHLCNELSMAWGGPGILCHVTITGDEDGEAV